MSLLPMPGYDPNNGGAWARRMRDAMGQGTGSNSTTSTDWAQRHPPTSVIADRLSAPEYRMPPRPLSPFPNRIPEPGATPNPGGQYVPPQAQVDTSKWNTDGYARPGYTATKAAGHPMGSWSRDKWNDPNHQTPKYAVGRILSQYAPSPENFKLAMAEIQKAYPGATMVGKDKLMIPGFSKPVDVGRSFSDGTNMSWHWGVEDDGGLPPQAGGVPGGFLPPGHDDGRMTEMPIGRPQMPDVIDQSFWQKLMERLKTAGSMQVEPRLALGAPTQALASQLKG